MTRQRYHRGQARTTAQPTITFQKGGIVSINGSAFEALSSPKAVYLSYDPDELVVGLEPADLGDEDAYPVRPSGSASGIYTISGSGFCNYWSIDTTVARRFAAALDDEGALCADLRVAPLYERRPGKKRPKASEGPPPARGGENPGLP